MKKGSKIQITDSAPYKGQEMNWTEPFSGSKKIGIGGEWVIHQSDRMIHKFLAKEICVHPSEHSKSYFENSATKKEITSKYHWKYYVYSIFLPEGFVVDTYSNDEYRFELMEGMDVIFSGTVYEAKKQTENNITKYIRYSDTINM